MKTLLKTTPVIIFIVIIVATSCSKESRPDPRDNFVGRWMTVEFSGKETLNYRYSNIQKKEKDMVWSFEGQYKTEKTMIISSEYKAHSKSFGIPILWFDSATLELKNDTLIGTRHAHSLGLGSYHNTYKMVKR